MTNIIRKIRKHLNLFDYLVIIGLLITLGILLFFRFSRTTEIVPVRISLSSNEWWWKGNPPEFWLVRDLNVGQKSFNTFGKQVAEITDIHIYDVGSNRTRSYVDINLQASFDKRRNIYLYNFQPLQIGKPLDLTFGENNVRGLVTYIGTDEQLYIQKEIEVQLYAIFPFEADSYKKGLQVKDSQGRILASIENVDVEEAQSYEFFDASNRRFVLEGTDPNRRDVTLRLKISTLFQNGIYFYIDGAAVKVGESIWFQFPQIVAKGAVISKIF